DPNARINSRSSISFCIPRLCLLVPTPVLHHLPYRTWSDVVPPRLVDAVGDSRRVRERVRERRLVWAEERRLHRESFDHPRSREQRRRAMPMVHARCGQHEHLSTRSTRQSCSWGENGLGRRLLCRLELGFGRSWGLFRGSFEELFFKVVLHILTYRVFIA